MTAWPASMRDGARPEMQENLADGYVVEKISIVWRFFSKSSQNIPFPSIGFVLYFPLL